MQGELAKHSFVMVACGELHTAAVTGILRTAAVLTVTGPQSLRIVCLWCCQRYTPYCCCPCCHRSLKPQSSMSYGKGVKVSYQYVSVVLRKDCKVSYQCVSVCLQASYVCVSVCLKASYVCVSVCLKASYCCACYWCHGSLRPHDAMSQALRIVCLKAS